MDKKVVIVGGGGHAKVIIAMLRLCGYEPAAVLDDAETLWGTDLLGVPVRGPISSLNRESYRSGIIGIGSNHIRQELARRVTIPWLTVIHPNAWVDQSVVLGAGTVVFAGAMIQPGTIIGEHVIINTAASVDHDCVIGNFVHIAPGTHLAGNVRVEEGTFMGIGSAAIPGTKIGAWTTIGAGAVVVREIPEKVVAFGVPAKPQRPTSGGETPGRPDGRSARMLSTRDKEEWLEVLERIPDHDFYHLPQYHALEEKMGRGAAYLFSYTQGQYHIALPVMLRSITGVPGLEETAEPWCDASSVYGYVGPVVSHTNIPPQVIESFQHTLREALTEMEVVTVFSRLHPLLWQGPILRGLGECRPSGQTISIDLTRPLDEQRQKYRKGHRSDISKARAHEVLCEQDADMSHLDDFVAIYGETMKRVKAERLYFFDRGYFDALIAALNHNIHLFLARLKGEIIAGALFVECNGILQYHLGGAKDEYKHLAPMKQILDSVRIWATGRGLRIFHLGGGVASREDSLFYFKSGFSDRRHQFSTWQWIVLPEVYKRLCQERMRWEQQQGLTAADSEFFPYYRSAVNAATASA